MGFSGKRKRLLRPPSPLVRIGLGKRRPATSPSPPIPSPFLPFWWTPTRTWSPSRTPYPGRTLCLGRPPPPPSFIYRGRGHPIDTQVDLRDLSLAVCGAPLHHIPPRSYRCSA